MEGAATLTSIAIGTKPVAKHCRRKNGHNRRIQMSACWTRATIWQARSIAVLRTPEPAAPCRSTPRANHPDECRDLKVVVGKPGLAARTRTRYYNQPQPQADVSKCVAKELDEAHRTAKSTPACRAVFLRLPALPFRRPMPRLVVAGAKSKSGLSLS